MSRIEKAGLQVAAEYVDFIEGQALPGSGVSADAFWDGLSHLAHAFGPVSYTHLRAHETRGNLVCR
ncbi:MAG: hypothetical protein ACRBBO_01465, partial [Cognatishimia sp.]